MKPVSPAMARRKKKRTHKPEEVAEGEKKRTPRCFIMKRGKLGTRLKDLVQDFRMVMMPHTAKGLKESKSNRLKDFLAVAGPLNVSHLVMISATKMASYMKLIKLPQGPTLTFQIESFSRITDVRSSQRRPRGGQRDYTSPPLQVLNGFGGLTGSEKQLTSEMLRGMFPPVDLPTFNHAECRRAALFHYDKQRDCIHFRHFTVGRKRVGLQKGVSKLLRTVRIPKMGHSEDVADFVLSGGLGASDTEAEDAEEVPLASRDGGKVAVRLTEIGPRLELKLIKAEEGICDGAVLYHRFNTKTPSQMEVYEQRARERRKLKARNEKLEGKYLGKKREMNKKAEARAANRKASAKGGGAEGEEDDAGGPAPEAKGKKDGGGVAPAGGKRKRFHPFSFGSKASKKAATGGEGTVEFDSTPAKKARKGTAAAGAANGKGGGKGKTRG